jgi:hypothetical protein
MTKKKETTSKVSNTLAIIGAIAAALLMAIGLFSLFNMAPLAYGNKPAVAQAVPTAVTPGMVELVPTPNMEKSEDGTPPKPTVKPPEKSVPTVEPTVEPTVRPSAEAISSGELGEDWLIKYFVGVTSEMKAWVFPVLDPVLWPMFPNVDNGKYLASQGVEYGEDLDTFCQQGQTCDFVVAARHYRLYTGDYDFAGVVACVAKDRRGCAFMVVNVGEVTAIFRDQHFDTGFTVTGRYWDGNYLPQAIWAVLSHASNNMLNLNSSLNPSPINNAGANCSVPEGCLSVENTFVLISGNEILLIGRSVVAK